LKNFKIEDVLLNKKENTLQILVKIIKSNELLIVTIGPNKNGNCFLQSDNLYLNYIINRDLDEKEILIIKTIFSIVKIKKYRIFN